VGEFSPWSYYLFHVSGQDQPITLARDENASFPPYDRSTDSEWLVIPRTRYLEVVGLKHTLDGNRPYRRLLAHTFNNCRSALFTW
jgi:hypothetical protein